MSTEKQPIECVGGPHDGQTLLVKQGSEPVAMNEDTEAGVMHLGRYALQGDGTAHWAGWVRTIPFTR